mmetsp:Transcript_58383/g.170731  ORF Transcript_58383/g.170731 Transcript_58383/m.170731 type:complete len:244 (+) Transcript_58383:428-1159(+)
MAWCRASGECTGEPIGRLDAIRLLAWARQGVEAAVGSRLTSEVETSPECIVPGKCMVPIPTLESSESASSADLCSASSGEKCPSEGSSSSSTAGAGVAARLASSSSSSSSKSWPPLSKLASSSFNSLPPLSTMSRCSCTEVAMAARVSWPMICSCRSIAFLARSMLLPPAVQKTNLRQGFAILMHLRRSRPMPRFPGASVLTNWTTSSPAFAVRKAMEAVRGRESTLLLSQLLPHFLERLHVN